MSRGQDVAFSAREHDPRDPRCLVCQSYCGDLRGLSLQELRRPAPTGVFLSRKTHDRGRANDEETPYVAVALLTDADLALFAAAAVSFGGQPQPSRELPA